MSDYKYVAGFIGATTSLEQGTKIDMDEDTMGQERMLQVQAKISQPMEADAN